MDGLKPWQIVLLVVAVLVLAGSLWLTFSGSGPDFGSRVYMVDVVSGELFVADTEKQRGMVLPAKHPETGERTLLPVEIGEDEKARISSRYRSSVEQILYNQGAELAGHIDPQSWLIDTDIESAETYVRP